MGDEFTVEIWVYLLENGLEASIFGFREGSNDGRLSVYFSTNDRFTVRYNVISYLISNGRLIFPLHTWIHVAATLHDNKLMCFVNGQETHNIDTSYVSIPGRCVIGDRDDTKGPKMDGYVSNFRITKNIARYTSNFTPPTKPFPNK